uniref:Uncharacterized protein n=1 Tax=Utricularia reniformis TaxID=192314 RepID=A0A1Y0B347_9LAMI|nr:hypothetical protein AEK19_MT1684 [Utricularia reniformis]ART31866.1 hypothetical protein AEK19_MT1684 [Utricularia reniformis]
MITGIITRKNGMWRYFSFWAGNLKPNTCLHEGFESLDNSCYINSSNLLAR